MGATQTDLKDWSLRVLNGRSFACDIAALAGLADDEDVVKAGPEGARALEKSQKLKQLVEEGLNISLAIDGGGYRSSEAIFALKRKRVQQMADFASELSRFAIFEKPVVSAGPEEGMAPPPPSGTEAGDHLAALAVTSRRSAAAAGPYDAGEEKVSLAQLRQNQVNQQLSALGDVGEHLQQQSNKLKLSHLGKEIYLATYVLRRASKTYHEYQLCPET